MRVPNSRETVEAIVYAPYPTEVPPVRAQFMGFGWIAEEALAIARMRLPRRDRWTRQSSRRSTMTVTPTQPVRWRGSWLERSMATQPFRPSLVKALERDAWL